MPLDPSELEAEEAAFATCLEVARGERQVPVGAEERAVLHWLLPTDEVRRVLVTLDRFSVDFVAADPKDSAVRSGEPDEGPRRRTSSYLRRCAPGVLSELLRLLGVRALEGPLVLPLPAGELAAANPRFPPEPYGPKLVSFELLAGAIEIELRPQR